MGFLYKVSFSTICSCNMPSIIAYHLAIHLFMTMDYDDNNAGYSDEDNNDDNDDNKDESLSLLVATIPARIVGTRRRFPHIFSTDPPSPLVQC